ncbi:MAG: hypothetical protein FJ304_10590 [Planctomycetes bacterium]|nr:hypothetical protein [Planctomycetota bacterium]
MPTEPTASDLRGEVVYLYAFDVANEIRLDRAAELLAGRSTPFAVRPDRPAPKTVPVSRPLVVEPPVPAASVNGSALRLHVRVFEVGVVSATVRVPFAGGALAALAPFHTPTLNDGRPLDALAREQCDDVCRAIGAALVRPVERSEPEAYTVFALAHLGGDRDANRWLAGHEREVAGLLTGTPGDRLSGAQVADVLRLRRSFENTDLVVIDWDAALVVDPDRGAEDVLFVIELANLQLEEFRWMDRQLDRYLDRAYDDLARRQWWSFGAMGRILRSLRQLRVDLTKLADEVAHITKFVGDWHLARVYLLARERFHLDRWRESVEQRLAEVDRLYTLTRGDVYERRMLWLEIVVVVFFAVDLFLLLSK